MPTITETKTNGTGATTPARNNSYELSGKAVAVAWKNAKRMVKEGYLWIPDGVFVHEGGHVLTPLGKCYDVWLPGVWGNYPEGKCDCAYFLRHAICKHIYFAVAQVQIIKAIAPAVPAVPIGSAVPAPGF